MKTGIYMVCYKEVIDFLIFTALFDIPDEIRGSDSKAPRANGKKF
jgi:hypothetical protein